MPRRPTAPADIEIHRLKFNFAGKRGKLVHFDSLSDADRSIISREIFTAISADKSGRDPYEICFNVLLEWGVMCFHPQDMRQYGGSLRSTAPRRDHVWFTCDVCKCLVINSDFDSTLIRRTAQ